MYFNLCKNDNHLELLPTNLPVLRNLSNYTHTYVKYIPHCTWQQQQQQAKHKTTKAKLENLPLPRNSKQKHEKNGRGWKGGVEKKGERKRSCSRDMRNLGHRRRNKKRNQERSTEKKKNEWLTNWAYVACWLFSFFSHLGSSLAASVAELRWLYTPVPNFTNEITSDFHTRLEFSINIPILLSSATWEERDKPTNLNINIVYQCKMPNQNQANIK